MSVMSKDETTQIALRVPASLAQAIDRQARDEGISRSDVVRRATMRDLQRQPLIDEQAK
jgi:metal-responsive CopG/Arc/MetJ family transcriptional regulator